MQRKSKYIFYVQRSLSENRAVYEIMWINRDAGQATHDNTIRRMRFACRITKATNTHPEYVIIVLTRQNC